MEDPPSDVDDDFDTADFDSAAGLAAREAEYEHLHGVAVAAGVPARRSSRAGLLALRRPAGHRSG